MKGCPPEDEIIEFASGSLAGDRRAAFEQHIDGCPSCAGLVALAARTGEIDETRVSAPAGAPELELVTGHPELERYVFLGELGAGAMGRVYLAFDQRLNRQVAIKLVLDRKDDRVLREAQAAASLRHPNVVTVHEAGSTGDVAYIVMEYVSGTTLRRWLEQSRPWRDTLAKFLAVGEGLAAAHEAGLLHRDFKPDNVLLDHKGRPKVADFGLARAFDDAPSPSPAHSGALSIDITATGMVMGTPAYMAPEQHRGGSIGPAADQYAFCTALYEGLFGERPFSGSDVRSLAKAKHKGVAAVRPPSAGVPGWLAKVVLRGLEAKPDARWSSMRSLLDAMSDRPWRRRVSIAGAAAAVSAVAIAGGLEVRAEQARVAQCRELGVAVFDTWNPERADDLQTQFEAMPQAFASNSFSLARERMSAYAVRYAVLRTSSCLGRTDRSAGLQAAANRCFEDALMGVEKTVGGWESPTDGVVRGVASDPLMLRRLDECVSKNELERRLVANASDVSLEEFEKVQAGYEPARTLVGSGEVELGEAEAAAGVEKAKAIGAFGLASAFGLTLCDAQRRQSKLDQARRSCERSFEHAVMGLDHEGAFHTGSALASLAGMEGNTELAELWLRLAESHLTHLVEGERADNNTARLAMAKGYLASDSGENAKALEHYLDAGRQYDEVHGEFSLLSGFAWVSAAHAASLVGKFDVAIQAAETALDRRRLVYGEDHPLTVEASQYVASFRYQTDADRAREEFSALASRVEGVHGERSVLAADVYAEWANAAHAVVGCDAALTPAREAVERTPEVSGRNAPVLTIIAECAAGSDPEESRAALDRVLGLPERDVPAALRKRLATVEERLAAGAATP